jgi:DNA-binding transcriptional MerR regulator
MSSTSQAEPTPELDAVSCSVEARSQAVFAKSADAFRTIGEAATELGLRTHVLRFWETKFDNLRPMKRSDGRRYYRSEDMEMLRQLQNLLHVQGLTIRGAMKVLGDRSGTVPGGEGEGQDDMAVTADNGSSVRDLQEAVRDAVERGDFHVQGDQASAAAKSRLESLLAYLTNLKLRLDAVRTAA